MRPEKVELEPIAEDQAEAVCRFLHDHMNDRVDVEAWRSILRPPWSVSAPNHGFMLRAGRDLVGVYVAVYSVREIHGKRIDVCNLAAFCVIEAYRAHGFRLVRALVGQRGYLFTDLSPSGHVVTLNERLGFTRLDTATQLVANFPALAHRGVRVSDDLAVVQGTVTGRDADLFRDHRGARAARHIVVASEDTYAYMIFRKDRRKGLPLFATPLYASGDTALLQAAWPQVGALLLTHHGALATLAEPRILGFAPRVGVRVRNPRPRMYRGGAAPAAVDYLYSELTLLEW